MRAIIPLFMLALLGVLSPSVAIGKPVFRWEDADGVAHFGDRPGAPEAEPVRPGTAPMSVVDTSAARAHKDNAMRPIIEREIRWQEQGRAEQRRQAERELADKERRCGRLRDQLRKAELAGQRAREMALEEQYYRGCR